MIRASSKPIVTLPTGFRVCPRCGAVREVNVSRPVGLCRDCKACLTAAEREAWAA